MGILVALYFLGGLPEKGAHFFLGGCDLNRNCGMGVIFFYFICRKCRKNAATLMKDSFFLADSKLEVYQK